MSTGYENDGVPFGGNTEDLGFRVGAGIADGKTHKQIKDENDPRLPTGRHDFIVKEVFVDSKDAVTQKPAEKVFNVFMPDGEGKYTVPATYKAHSVCVVYGLRDNPRLTIREYHTLVPRNEDDIPLYLEGSRFADSDKGGESYSYNQMRSFLSAIGHPDGPNGALAPESQVLGNWLKWPDGSHRTASLLIVMPKMQDPATGKWVDKKNEDGSEVYPKIKAFSHQRTKETLAKLGIIPGNAPAPPAARPASAPAPAAPVRPPAAGPRPPAAGPRPPVAAPAAPAAPAPPAPPAGRVRHKF